MLQLSRDASSCPHALELLKKVAGALACGRNANSEDMTQQLELRQPGDGGIY